MNTFMAALSVVFLLGLALGVLIGALTFGQERSPK